MHIARTIARNMHPITQRITQQALRRGVSPHIFNVSTRRGVRLHKVTQLAKGG